MTVTAADDLYWNEPDAGCVTCAQPVLTVADHRCGTCLGGPLLACPHCLGELGPVLDREIARRARETSWDVAEEWNRGNYFRALQRALDAKQARLRRFGLAS
jgi:hypothetical protein